LKSEEETHVDSNVDFVFAEKDDIDDPDFNIKDLAINDDVHISSKSAFLPPSQHLPSPRRIAVVW
jgi:hypothetical protein